MVSVGPSRAKRGSAPSGDQAPTVVNGRLWPEATTALPMIKFDSDHHRIRATTSIPERAMLIK